MTGPLRYPVGRAAARVASLFSQIGPRPCSTFVSCVIARAYRRHAHERDRPSVAPAASSVCPSRRCFSTIARSCSRSDFIAARTRSRSCFSSSASCGSARSSAIASRHLVVAHDHLAGRERGRHRGEVVVQARIGRFGGERGRARVLLGVRLLDGERRFDRAQPLERAARERALATNAVDDRATHPERRPPRERHAARRVERSGGEQRPLSRARRVIFLRRGKAERRDRLMHDQWDEREPLFEARQDLRRVRGRTGRHSIAMLLATSDVCAW